MSALIPYGTFPTPYGVTIPAFHPGGDTAGEPDHFLFDMDGTAIFAGIHSKVERKRFAEDATRLGYAPRFENYGGHPIPREPLSRPQSPVYPKMQRKDLTPVEEWITGILDLHRWCDRADFFLGIIGDNLRQPGVGDSDLRELYPLALSSFLTATLEHLGETEIDCIEAASIYALTMHGDWIAAGTEWLEPFRTTWFRDWVAARPNYSLFARSLQSAMNLPSWLGEAGCAA